MLFHFSFLSGKLPNFKHFFAEKFLSFSFFVSSGLFGSFFSREIGFLWTVALNIRVLAEKFSSVFSKVPSSWERERSCFFWLLYFFLLEPENNLSKIGQKTRHFSQRSKILVQKNILPSFPRENAFSFLYFERKTSRLWEKLLQKVLSFSFCVCERKTGKFFFKWNVPLVKYFERKTSTLWSKPLRQKSQFFNFRVQRKLWLFSRRFRLFFGLYA